MADVMVVDCGSNSGIQPVLVLLDGLQVKAVSSVGDHEQHLQGLKADEPCAVICVACSRHDESRGLVDETLRSVGSRPVLVIDECFDNDYAHLLLERGVQDYLDVEKLSSEKLHRDIEWAILRNRHRLTTLLLRQEHAAENNQSELRRIYDGLPPRERQVLELLATGLTPKKIACKLGTRPKTVWNPIANIRVRFDVNSNHALALLVLQRIQKESNVE